MSLAFGKQIHVTIKLVFKTIVNIKIIPVGIEKFIYSDLLIPKLDV